MKCINKKFVIPVNKNSIIFHSILRSFQKRVAVVVMAIILCFNTICKPIETKAAAAGAVATDVVTQQILIGVCTSAASIFIAEGVKGAKALFNYIRNGNESMKDKSDEEIESYLKTQITINGNGNYVLTDEAQALLQGAKSEYKKDVNMVYGYTFPTTTIDPLYYSQKKYYDAIKDFIDSNGDYVFVCAKGWFSDVDYFAVKKDSIAGLVCSSLDGALVGYLYDTNWEACKGYGVKVDETGVMCLVIRYVYGNMWNAEYIPINSSLDSMISEYKSYEKWMSPNLGKEVDFTYRDGGGKAGVYEFDCGRQMVRLASNLVKDFDNDSWKVYYQSCTNIECYKTLNDLKRGTNFATLGGYLPSYAPDSVKKTVTPQEVTQPTPTPYPTSNPSTPKPGGNNSDDDNNDDNGGNGIWSALGSAIGSLLKGIGSLLTSAIESIAEIFTSLLEAMKNIIQYLTKDVAEFFKDVLSFMPQAWVDRITLGLSLVLIGFIIKLLVKG